MKTAKVLLWVWFAISALTLQSSLGQTWIRSSTLNMYGGSVASSADGLKLVAAQFNGSLYTSTNAGKNWRQVNSPAGQAWTSLASSANGSNLVAVAFNGPIYTSKNAGATWPTSSAPVLPWVSIASSASGNVLLAATYDSFLFISTNAGASWTSVAGPAYWGPTACSADGLKLLAVKDGIVITSDDAGATWIAATNGPSDPTGIASSADGTRLVAVANSQIYISGDSGVTWLAASNAPVQPWEAVASSADGSSLAAVIDGGAIYTSANSGVSWQSNNAPTARWSSVASSGNGQRLVAACNLGVYVLSDYDLTIIQSASPPVVGVGSNITFTINVTNLGPGNAPGVLVMDTLPTSVNFVSAEPSWTSNAGVLTFGIGQMTNGAIATITIQTKGSTLGLWTNTATVSSALLEQEITNNSYAIPFGIALPGARVWTKSPAPNSPWWQDVDISADGRKLVAVGGYGGIPPLGICSSTNGGLTWSTNVGPSAQWTCVASSADGTVLVAGAWGTPLYLSTNSGSTWIPTSSLVGQWIDVAASADGRVLLGGNYGNSLRISTNFGATWGVTGSPGYWGPVAASSDGSKLIACNQGMLHTSTNAGAIWTSMTNTPIVVASVDCSADGNRLIASPYNNGGSRNGHLHISTDFGVTWSAATNSANILWVGVASSGDGRILAGTTYFGTIYTSRDFGMTWTMGLLPANAWGDVTISEDGATMAAVGQGGIFVSRPPSLNISKSPSSAVVAWPSLTWDFGLQLTYELPSTNWLNILGPIIDEPTMRKVLINSTSNQSFFRMKQ